MNHVVRTLILAVAVAAPRGAKRAATPPSFDQVAKRAAEARHAEQLEEGGLILGTMVREGKETPAVVEGLGLNVLRMPFLPREMPPDKRELA